MEPALHNNHVYVEDHIDFKDVRKEMIVDFVEDCSHTRVCHRVIGGWGNKLITKGDANRYEDRWYCTPENFIAVVREPKNTNMSLTTKQLVDAHTALMELINGDKQNKFVLSSAVRIRLAGNVRKTKDAVDEYIKERNELVTKLGQPVLGKDGNPVDGQLEVPVGTENYKKFVEEVEAMNAEVSEITLATIKEHELFGVTEKAYKDESRDGTKDNQIPADLIAILQDLKILV